MSLDRMNLGLQPQDGRLRENVTDDISKCLTLPLFSGKARASRSSMRTKGNASYS